ncbi:MAG: hypothetical protein JSW60_08765 [Thermoplasmatales archaeon]|nr:MAG: hypothetical protein JSW60_08765 [Thermoplasmatales archaeon]
MMAIGLDFVKKVDRDWEDHLTFLDGTPYKNPDFFEVTTMKLNRIERIIDGKL